MLVPKMRDAGLADAVVDASKVVVVGDTVADIQFTRNIGARACWTRHGYGERVECAELKADFTIEKLMDVMTIIGVAVLISDRTAIDAHDQKTDEERMRRGTREFRSQAGTSA